MGAVEGTRSKSDYLIWKQVVVDPWEIRVYCKGCLSNGATYTLALLDVITNVPPKSRFEVARWLRDSVGCPMSGPSHMETVIRAFKVQSDGTIQPVSIREAA